LDTTGNTGAFPVSVYYFLITEYRVCLKYYFLPGINTVKPARNFTYHQV